MGLNSRDIQYSLYGVLHFSAMISYTFVKRHPLFFTSLVAVSILYIFHSYIFSFLICISPFLVFTAIFVRIFWSSEQNLVMRVKSEEKKGEKKESSVDEPNIPTQAVLVRNPSSRRRNFTAKKLDVYGDLEHKAKDLSEVFKNEFTTKSTTKLTGSRSFRKEESYLGYDFSISVEEKIGSPTKEALFSEPSMIDLVDHHGVGVGSDGNDDKKEETEGEKVEAEQPKAEEESSNKSFGVMEDDQNIEMDLGIAETERTKRLESLMARRRLRRLLKMQIEKGLVDMKSVIPGKVAPLAVTTRLNPFDSAREYEVIDGIEMPGSAPSLRSPFDIPYDPFEEKPVLTGDGFGQEFTSSHQKEGNVMFSRHESFTYGFSSPLDSRQDWLPYSRNRRHLGTANHGWLDQLIARQGSERKSIGPSPLSEGEETIEEVDENCETDMKMIKDDEETEIAYVTKSKPNHSEITNSVERVNDSVYHSLPFLADKNQGNMFITGRGFSHEPSLSLASDLHVEVSEAGSPTLTVDENHDTVTTTDAESIIYDGDIEKDVTSGSEDMWGASLHMREARRVSEQDISEMSNWKDIVSPSSLQNIDEENAADVSSMSSKSDMPEDTPLADHATSSDHNIFGNVNYFMGRTNPSSRPSSSSKAPPRRRRLDQAHSEKPEEWCNLSDNLINKTEDNNDVNNSKTIEQDNTQNSKSDDHKDNDASVVRQETIDEASINSSSSSSSPRSVKPPNDMEEQAPSSSYNQELNLGVQQSNMENIAQATSNGEGPHDTTPQNIQPLVTNEEVGPHNIELTHSQEQSYPLENSNQESIMSSMMNDSYKEKLKIDDKNEDTFSSLSRQDDRAESSRMVESSSEVYTDNEDKSKASIRQEATMEPLSNFDGNYNDLNKNEVSISSGSQLEKPYHNSEEVDFLQSEAKQIIEDHNMKHDEKLDRGEISENSSVPMVTEVTNDGNTVGEISRLT